MGLINKRWHVTSEGATSRAEDVAQRVFAIRTYTTAKSKPQDLHAEIDPRELRDELFIGYSDTPHVLRDVVNKYFRKCGVKVTPRHYLDNFATGISLVASTRGITLLPSYAEPLLPWSVVSRKLKGKAPTIDLAVAYRADNPSPVLKTFLAGIGTLIAAGPAGLRNDRPVK
jgi:LysR family hca operon transcriptional activator